MRRLGYIIGVSLGLIGLTVVGLQYARNRPALSNPLAPVIPVYIDCSTPEGSTLEVDIGQLVDWPATWSATAVTRDHQGEGLGKNSLVVKRQGSYVVAFSAKCSNRQQLRHYRFTTTYASKTLPPASGQ